jgi:hypothetical protein
VDLFVSVLDEIVQEFAADLGAGQHVLGFNGDNLILASGRIVRDAVDAIRRINLIA